MFCLGHLAGITCFTVVSDIFINMAYVIIPLNQGYCPVHPPVSRCWNIMVVGGNLCNLRPRDDDLTLVLESASPCNTGSLSVSDSGKKYSCLICGSAR